MIFHPLEKLAYTIDDVADVLQLSERKVRSLIAAGVLPKMRNLGGSVRVSKVVLERWVEQQSEEAS